MASFSYKKVKKNISLTDTVKLRPDNSLKSRLNDKINDVKLIRRIGVFDLSKDIDSVIRRNIGNSRNCLPKTRNYLWIVFWVKKFIEILKSQIEINKLNKLQPHHWNIINDKSYFPPNSIHENQAYKINNPFIEKIV